MTPENEYLAALKSGEEITDATLFALWKKERQRERKLLGNEAQEAKLEEFCKWVKRRKALEAIGLNAPIDQDILELVAQGVAQHLAGKKPWPKRRGNKTKRDLTWKCYWLVNFYKTETDRLPQHKEEGGAFHIVGNTLNLSPEAVESHVTNAKKLIKTADGKRDFELWLSDYRYNGGAVVISDQKR